MVAPLTRELGGVFLHVGQYELISVCDDEAMSKHFDGGADEAVGWAVELWRVRGAAQGTYQSKHAPLDTSIHKSDL